jgi:exosortase
MSSSVSGAIEGEVEAKSAPVEASPRVDYVQQIKAVVLSPYFGPAVACLFGIGVIFWPLLRSLPDIWMSKDGYYSHGFLIPFIAIYIFFSRWDRTVPIKAETGWVALAFLLPLMFVLRAANHAEIIVVLSAGLIACLLLCTWFVAGWRWMLAVFPAVAYLIFALPVWTMAIDNYTNPLQIVSTKVAFAMIKLTGLHGFQTDPTTLVLPSGYTLNVAVPCSGLKLLLAVSAFMVFFLLVARLKWWGNLAMVIMVLPLCLFINGLRIALIGLVGQWQGDDAAHQFHDYSGIITLLVCFFILFKSARWLGWKV